MRNIGSQITPGCWKSWDYSGGGVGGEIPGGGGGFHIIVLQHTIAASTPVGDPAKLAHYFQIQEGELRQKRSPILGRQSPSTLLRSGRFPHCRALGLIRPRLRRGDRTCRDRGTAGADSYCAAS